MLRELPGALAGGSALLAEARAQELPGSTVRDVVDLALEADPRALVLVRERGRRLGEVLAGLVNSFTDRAGWAGAARLAVEAHLSDARVEALLSAAPAQR